MYSLDIQNMTCKLGATTVSGMLMRTSRSQLIPDLLPRVCIRVRFPDDLRVLTFEKCWLTLLYVQGI
jgi:hypothetical protein